MPIRRNEIRDLLIKRGAMEPVGRNADETRRGILLLNSGTTALCPGDEVVITGRLYDGIDTESAQDEYLTYGFQCRGRAPKGEDFGETEPVLATAEETIPAGGCGEVALPGLFAARVTVRSASHLFARGTETGFETAQEGDYRIVARTDQFAFLLRVAAPEKNGCTVWNMTDSDRVAGDVLEIRETLVSPEQSPEEAQAEYLASGAVLAGITPSGDPAQPLAILLEDIPAGKSGKGFVPGLFGQRVTIRSHQKFSSGEGPLWYPYAAAGKNEYGLISTRNNLYDRRNRTSSYDFGAGGGTTYRIVARSASNERGEVFAYLVPGRRAGFLAEITSTIPIAANRWLYAIREVVPSFGSDGFQRFQEPGKSRSWKSLRGWAYNACEPTQEPFPTRSREKVAARLPLWDSENQVWTKESESVTLTQTVRPAQGRVYIWGDAFQGWYFSQLNLPLIENLLLVSDGENPPQAVPELKIGEGLTLSDGGEASDEEARREGTGRKAQIDWEGMNVSASDWSSPRGGIREICFGSDHFSVTVKNGKAIIKFKAG